MRPPDVAPRQVNPKRILGGRESVRVAIVQRSQAYMDRGASIDRAAAAIAEAGAAGAQLIVFPENWLAGYPYWTDGWNSDRRQWIEGRVRFHDAAIMVPSDSAERLASAARAANAIVVMGANEMDERPESEAIYSSLLFFDHDGTYLGSHRKLMPTGQERSFWGCGDATDLRVFDTDIGRIGGLICGEHTMTLARAALIAQREDFHVSAWHGSFTLAKGPTLVEDDTQGTFFGLPLSRAHAVESGAFTLMACSWFDEYDLPADFPYARHEMNLQHSNGGSAIINPMGVPLVGPAFEGPAILYADCPAWMRKARAAILDTFGHYGRPDLLQLCVRTPEGGWQRLGGSSRLPRQLHDDLRRSAERFDVDEDRVLGLLETVPDSRTDV